MVLVDEIQTRLSDLSQLFNDAVLKNILEDSNDPLGKLLTEYYNITNLKKRANNNSTSHIVYKLNNIVKKMIKDKKWNSWLTSKIKDYVKTNKPEQKYAILGEIHTISIFNNITELTPVATVKDQQTSDFMYNYLKEKVNIEVNTPSMNEKEAKRQKDEMTKFQNNLSPDVPVQSYIMEISPMGNNPKYSTAAENCISKISNIKFGKKQLKENEMNILVINFLNDDMWCVNYEHTTPIIAGGMYGFFSGNLWQALYAKHGDLVLEGYKGIGKIAKLQFDGMFQRKENRKISAVLFIFSAKTVLMENPYAQKSLSSKILQSLFNLSDFDYDLSYVRWPKPFYKKLFFDAFKQKINNKRKLINSIQKSDVEPV